MDKPKELVWMLVPNTTAFFAFACILVLELAASRLIARELGSSLYTWTSVLAVVLAGVSAGSYLGGRIVDRHDARRALAVLFGLASGACVGMIVVDNVVGDWAWLWRLDWPIHVFIHVVLVLLVPSILLGTVGPATSKIAFDQGRAAGRTIGDLYAWSAAGGVAGILLAGFYLIPTFGTATIVWGIGAALLAMAILYWTSCWVMYLWAMILGALMTMGMAPADWAQDAGTAAMLRRPVDPNLVYEDETPYGRVGVRQTSKRPDRRVFVLDQTVGSETILGDETNLQQFHTRAFAALTHGLCQGKSAPSMMLIGAGGYAFARYLQAVWPNSCVEVVEIDPGVTAAAAAAFGLDQKSPILTIHRDARFHVEQLVREGSEKGTLPRYDFIYQDILDGCAVPFQLATQEFHGRIARLLAEDGAYLIRLIDTSDNSRFLGAVVNTIRQTFPHIYIISSEITSSSLRSTFVVVATMRPIGPSGLLAGHNRHLKSRLLDQADVDRLTEQAGNVILTDDFAPVEQMLTPAVRQGATEIFAYRWFREAGLLQAKHEHEQSIAAYRQAASLNPSLALDAYKEIGLMHVAQNQSEQAVAAFEDAIKAHAETGGRPATLGEVHMRLGTLLDGMDRPAESKKHFAEAAQWFRIELDENPRFIVVWDWLGEVRAMTGDFKPASDAFAKALALEPANPEHYRKLARALERQNRYDEAIPVVKKHIHLMQEQGNRDMANQLRTYLDLLEYNRVKQPR